MRSAAGLSKRPPLDRRSAESILGRNRVIGSEFDANGVRKTSRNDLENRLGELEAEKGAMDREKVGAAAQKSAEEASVIAQLKARDGDVRAHEAAHIAAGGRYITGGANFVYERGPDGVSYAIGGEVGIDSSPIPGHPEETLAKMEVVRAAALAPADPSAADLSVAAEAAQAMGQAMAEIAADRAKSAETAGTNGQSEAKPTGSPSAAA